MFESGVFQREVNEFALNVAENGNFGVNDYRVQKKVIRKFLPGKIKLFWKFA